MATQAQRLMSMFADATRQYKFIALRTELGNWDVNSRGDAQGARMKLENALRDIGERPLDDMVRCFRLSLLIWYILEGLEFQRHLSGACSKFRAPRTCLRGSALS